jgi:guanylate kinase
MDVNKRIEKYYSVHDIVAFKIIENVGLLGEPFKNRDPELQDFESIGMANHDFTVYLGKFTPHNQDCYFLDEKYYIKEDYLYCKDSYRYVKWELEISGFGQSNMEVRLNCNLPGKMFASDLIINHLIWLKLNEKGYPIIHGSGVSKEGKAYMFAGQGASGKSTIALNLIERGFKLLGDHFVILNNGYIMSFRSALHITGFNITPSIKDNMCLKHKVFFYSNELLYKLMGRGTATKINVKGIFPNSLEDKAKLHSIFLLLPKEKFKAERISREDLISHLVMNQKLESFPSFIKYMVEYAYLFPQSNLATYWEHYEENLRRALSQEIEIYKLEVPRRYDAKTLNAILQKVEVFG